jgi:hypothetical protein
MSKRVVAPHTLSVKWRVPHNNFRLSYLATANPDLNYNLH